MKRLNDLLSGKENIKVNDIDAVKIKASTTMEATGAITGASIVVTGVVQGGSLNIPPVIDWTDLTLETGWEVATNYVAQYKLCSGGFVCLRGRVKRVAGGTTKICNIPATIRPAYSDMYMTPIVGASNTSVEIKTDGDILSTLSENAVIDLSHIYQL